MILKWRRSGVYIVKAMNTTIGVKGLQAETTGMREAP